MTTNEGCGRVRGRLEELLDGGLSSLEEARDRGHLEACADCREAHERWSALLDVVAESMRPAPDEVEAEIRAMRAVVADTLPRRRLRVLSGRTVAALATVAAAILLLLALGSGELVTGAFDALSNQDLWPDWEIGLPTSTGIGR